MRTEEIGVDRTVEGVGGGSERDGTVARGPRAL